MYQKFDCGCLFEKTATGVKFTIEDIRYDCPATWTLFKKGLTKGIFQLESQLGRHWAKEVGPDNIEELSAIIAIMRPGVLKAIQDGKSMTQHYADRKNKKEPVVSYHPAIDPILFPTYNVLVYQEQAMEIAKAVAGFNLQEADMLRKAIGKKKPEEMAKVKKMFIDGVEKAGVISKEQGDELFSWIEKSQRYAFNKSHSVSYAVDGYWSAFAKAHFPVQFFTSYLRFAHEKQDPRTEIRELINESKLFDIDIRLPSFISLKRHFNTDGKSVCFGIGDIKGIGDSIYDKIHEVALDVEKQIGKPRWAWTWLEFLIYFSHRVNSTAIKAMISAGALEYNMSRNKMLYEFDKWLLVTDKEKDWFIANISKYTDFKTALLDASITKKNGGAAFNKNRSETLLALHRQLENPPMSLGDEIHWLAIKEEQLLGSPLSCHIIDGCDISQCTCSCREFLSGRSGTVLIAAEVKSRREVTIKNGKQTGKKMAFLTLEDGSGSLDSVVAFPDALEKCGSILFEGQTVLVKGKKDKFKDSLVIEKAWSI